MFVQHADICTIPQITSHRKNMKKWNILLILILMICLGACSSERSSITSKEDLNKKGIRVGTGEGSAAIHIIENELPEAELVYITGNTGYESVAQGKLDAYIYDRRQMQLAIDSGRKGVRLLNEDMDESVHIAAGISPESKIPDLENRINSFIAELKADGTLDDMYDRWVIKRDESMPEITLPEDPGQYLTVGTTGITEPYSYYVGPELNGFDIELARRFAAWLDMGLKFKVYDYGGIIPAAATGDVDCVMADLNVTPERAEALTFSDDLFEEKIAIMVRDTGEAEPEFTSFSELNGKRVSMLSGAPFEDLVKSKIPSPGELTYFSNMPDMLLALKSDKTDAILTNSAISALAVSRNPDLKQFPENLKDGVFGFALKKGNPEREKWQEAFERIPEEKIKEAWKKWTGADDSKKIMPEQDWPGLNGTVEVAACDTVEPMSYVGEGGEIVGFDNEVILMMAKELDVHVNFNGMEFSSILASVQSGKALIGTGSIIVTDERKESVDFIEYYPAAFVFDVRAAEGKHSGRAFLRSLSSSLEKNFVRESRWRLFLGGFLTTFIITLLSALFGTALGFILIFICKDGNPVANRITGFCLWIVQGMPIVVLLMILYYIVFGKMDVSGMIVSVICFTLVFGAGIFGLLKLSINTIDRGQYEAAYALGYSVNGTFFKIILPQALPHVMDAYKGEIVGLIKATAIVGYIAVQDLTKVGDIIRGRTYEAFFPLIAVAVIYFLMEGLFGSAVDLIKAVSDPRKRKRESILKGVKTYDKD